MGNTGLKVNEISLGSWLTYSNPVENETAINTIDKAYELGINFFDTSNAYNLGYAIDKCDRSSYVLATNWLLRGCCVCLIFQVR